MMGSERRMCGRWLLLGLLSCVCAAQGATRYDADGVLSARLETERWYINRARFEPEREADFYGLTNTTSGGHPDYDCCEDSTGANDFGTSTNDWAPWKVSKGPLAPNLLLHTAASNHCRDMAEQDAFQHASPSSNYYSLNDDPDDRHAKEGYTNLITGYYENIAWGMLAGWSSYPPFGRAPEDVHDGLYVDATASTRGHRKAILNDSALEIGLGHFQTNLMRYYGDPYFHDFFCTDDYDTQDFGRRTDHFFTGTIFHDADANGVYTNGEGVGDIEIRLWDDGQEGQWYDVSEPSGSFAVPINDHADGHEIDVALVNKSGSSQSLTVPLSWGNLGELELTNNETYIVGSYVQPAGLTNIGFRNLTPRFENAVSLNGTNISIRFNSLGRVTYRIESNDQHLTNASAWVEFDSLTATNGQAEFVDTGQGGRPAPPDATNRFYRVLLERE